MSNQDSTAEEEALRKKQKPAEVADVAGVLLRGWGLTLELDAGQTKPKMLESYDDRNYLVKDASSGNLYTMKIHNGVESSHGGILDAQNRMMHFLHEKGVCCPVPQKTVSGSLVHRELLEVADGSKIELAVRLLSWVHGQTMQSAVVTPGLLLRAGAFLGSVDAALDSDGGFDHEAVHRPHCWDMANTASIRPFTHHVKDPRIRALVEKTVDTFESDVVPDLPQMRGGVLVADFNDANVIVKASQSPGTGGLDISGVIDFGDVVYSRRVFDVAVAMAYATISAYGKLGRGLASAALLLRGFCSKYPLTAVEIKHLRVLTACRLATSITLGALSRAGAPENEYLNMHAKPANDALEMLWSSQPSDIDSLFARAINGDHDDPNFYLDIDVPDPTLPDPFARSRALLQATPRPDAKRSSSDGKPLLTFVTGNAKKLEEVKAILAAQTAAKGERLPYEVTNKKVDLPELQGEPVEIAIEKCRLAALEVGGPTMTEDTSLCFNAYKGLPGAYIKWFLQSLGHEGLNNMLAAYEDKSAYAQCIFAYTNGPGQPVTTFVGQTQGRIVPARGDNKFGWDPIFEPNESAGKTYAEMDKQKKNLISHRFRSLTKLQEFLAQNPLGQ